MCVTTPLTRMKTAILALVAVSSIYVVSLFKSTELATSNVRLLSTRFQTTLGNFSRQKEETSLTTHVRKQFHPEKIVFVWTLMRSGSSFLSSMVSALPGVYLSMEPVRRKLGSRFPVNETNEELLNILYSVSVCSPDFLMVSLNYRMNDYCLKMASGRKYFCDSVEFLAHMCSRARIHVLKIVTLRLGLMQRFVREHPDLNVQILHLVRDPRPVFASTALIAAHKASIGEDHHDFATEDVCENTRKDLASGVELRKQFPGRYHLVHYEDLALSPVTTLRGVLDFLGESYSAQLLATHRRLTYTFNDHVNKRVFGVDKYSKSHAFSWRSEMPFTQIQAIQETCQNVLHFLKLRAFEDEAQCRNMSVDVRLQGYSQVLNNDMFLNK